MFNPTIPKLKYIEGLRGLAAIIVVFHHYTLAFYPALNFAYPNQTHIGDGKIELFIAHSPLNLCYNGGFAVCIFFILSGYVLSNTYHQTQNTTIISHYAIKRYIRLFIPVSLTICIAYLLMSLGLMYNKGLDDIIKNDGWLSGFFNTDIGLFDVIKNAFINVFFFKDNTYNPVLWTMTYELLGSFLVFAFLLITHPFKNKYGLYALLIMVLIITQNYFYSAFITGAFLNAFMHSKKNGNQTKPFNQYLLVLCLLSGLFFASYPIGSGIENTMYGFITFSFIVNYEFYHVLGSFLIVLATLHSNILQHILSSKILVFIGKISFSFYLLHFIIMCSLSCYLFKFFYPMFGYNKSVLFSFLSSLPVIVITSIYYYKWIDKTGIRVSEKVLHLFISKK